MSGRRGLSRTLLSTGTTTEAQVIRQLQQAGWQQVPRLLLPIEIDQGQGGGILKTTDRIQRRVNRCRFDEGNAMKFHAAMKAIPLGVAALTARLVALLPLPAWALERLYINGSILTRAGERHRDARWSSAQPRRPRRGVPRQPGADRSRFDAWRGAQQPRPEEIRHQRIHPHPGGRRDREQASQPGALGPDYGNGLHPGEPVGPLQQSLQDRRGEDHDRRLPPRVAPPSSPPRTSRAAQRARRTGGGNPPFPRTSSTRR